MPTSTPIYPGLYIQSDTETPSHFPSNTPQSTPKLTGTCRGLK
uniref:Uncharacterized protein n=1 Tax=Desertifilum tharense IPPAS B-1220 TaxID=1781255 RepID=A0ACD5GU76_9CYAN